MQVVVQYPLGRSITSDGKILDNAIIAKSLVEALHSGKSITCPTQGWKIQIIPWDFFEDGLGI